jgi:hypothetical protein
VGGGVTERITSEAFSKWKSNAKRSKYGNRKVTADGIKFDSAKEAKRWGELRFLEQAGEISNLKRQVRIPLIGRDGPILTPTGRQSFYVADFTYVDWRLNGANVVEDSKGFETPEFKLKRAILAAQAVEILTT